MPLLTVSALIAVERLKSILAWFAGVVYTIVIAAVIIANHPIKGLYQSIMRILVRDRPMQIYTAAFPARIRNFYILVFALGRDVSTKGMVFPSEHR